MIVVVSLLTSGSDAGPFNLYTNADGYITPIAVNVSKAILTAGYVFSSVPAGTTLIRAKSLGNCTNIYTVGISPGGSVYTSTTTSTTTFNPALTTTTTSTSTSTTSTSTTIFVPRPTFQLSSQQLPGYGFIRIYNTVNGTRYNYNIGSTYTAPNTCLNPMGLIDPDSGESSFAVPSSTPCGTLYTVRVYNGANCSAYTDHTIAFCSTAFIN
jgi:hypothetical protein